MFPGYTAPMTRFTDDYLLFLLAQASHRASAGFHARLASEGIPVATWRILATLFPDAPAGIGALAQSCLTKQPTMTRRIDRLETQGLVTRSHEGGDRRRVTVRLTAKGRALAARLTAMAKAHEAQVLAGFDTAGVARLKKALNGLLTA